jgi:hypothetical protein
MFLWQPLPCSPDPDEQQDYHMINGSSIDGVTSISFWRYLDTGDAKDRVIDAATVNQMNLIWYSCSCRTVWTFHRCSLLICTYIQYNLHDVVCFPSIT